MDELERVGNHHRKVVAGLEREIEKMKETQRVLAETRQGALMRGEQQNALILRLESRTRALENELVSTHEQIAAMEAERDRYREFVEWLFIATADGTLNLDTPAILDGLQCRSAEVLGEERAEELLDALNREE